MVFHFSPPKCCMNNSRERRSPSSVSHTDFALPTGSLRIPYNGNNMKTKVITVMISLALTTVCFGQEKTPPTAIDCTFTNIDVVKLRLPGYSNTKVAPEDMAWLKPGADPYIPPGQLGRTEG